MVDDRPYNLGLWDTAGQEEYDQMRPLCFPQTDVFIICFSLISPPSYQNVKSRWVPELRKHADTEDPDFVLVGTKLDLRNSEEQLAQLKKDGITPISTEMGKALSKESGARGYFEISALTQDGLKAVFDAAARIVVNKFKKEDGKDVGEGGGGGGTEKGCCTLM
eukprot:CAMPEP_0117028814 /NCGR_PEP_ID=MMETSP0472-20121206/20920_1 /TAXON_ID=693140 ORGANISM="Tiarina fusus, Strain LIS" /NCGR_SAMPLE_ID=MMETSP0472 /ASSEMBLY_ACC=CAM_ASM_000603 /LENGTH=163 /DNA_ID=CAMNT_0004736411 /DNA_START=143 /DNA_END=634 /DNA_ORIENTATION=-